MIFSHSIQLSHTTSASPCTGFLFLSFLLPDKTPTSAVLKPPQAGIILLNEISYDSKWWAWISHHRLQNGPTVHPASSSYEASHIWPLSGTHMTLVIPQHFIWKTLLHSKLFICPESYYLLLIRLDPVI